MTQNQLRKIRNAGYKYWDNEVFEYHTDWSKREVSQFSFEAGAKYALANKHDELKEQSRNIVQFLKNNGVYEIFWDNLVNQNSPERIVYYLKNYFGTSITFSEAFTWSQTQEGLHFWCEVNDKWNE